MQASQIRLLVHARAPSTNGDDARWRALAEAYAAAGTGWTRISALVPSTIFEPMGEAQVENVYVEDTQRAWDVLESQFIPATTNPRRHRTRRTTRSSANEEQTAKELSEQDPGSPNSEDGSGLPGGRERATNSRTGSVEGRERPVSPSPDQGDSQLPSSFSLTDSDQTKSPARTLQRSASDPSGDSSASPLKLQRPPILRSAYSDPEGLVETRHRATPLSSNEAAQSAEWRADLPTAIRPPHPAASIDRITTHITPALRHLAEESPVSQCYHPVFTTRRIEPLERGHWLISCKSWERQVQLDFWRALETVIGNGTAGWGVWAHRGVEADLDAPNTVSIDDPDSLGPVRVYCWGEVAMHVYLLLYVASNSKVRRHGLQWIDADGQVVIQMRSSGT